MLCCSVGACSSALGGDIYLQDTAAGTDPDNMIYFKGAPTSANGTLAGNLANSIIIRSKASNTLEANGVRSFTLMVSRTDSRLQLCVAMVSVMRSVSA